MCRACDNANGIHNEQVAASGDSNAANAATKCSSCTKYCGGQKKNDLLEGSDAQNAVSETRNPNPISPIPQANTAVGQPCVSVSEAKFTRQVASPFSINRNAAVSDQVIRSQIRKEEQARQLNFEAFERCLQAFAETIESMSPDLSFSIKNAVCHREEDESITLEVSNTLAEEQIAHNKQKILSFVKQKTGMDGVVLQVKCKEFEQKRVIYSPKETYEHLKAKHPAIETLVKIFDCEFKY